MRERDGKCLPIFRGPCATQWASVDGDGSADWCRAARKESGAMRFLGARRGTAQVQYRRAPGAHRGHIHGLPRGRPRFDSSTRVEARPSIGVLLCHFEFMADKLTLIKTPMRYRLQAMGVRCTFYTPRAKPMTLGELTALLDYGGAWQ